VASFDHRTVSAKFKFKILPGFKKFSIRRELGKGAIRARLANKVNQKVQEEYCKRDGFPISKYLHIGEKWEY